MATSDLETEDRVNAFVAEREMLKAKFLRALIDLLLLLTSNSAGRQYCAS